MTRKARLRAAFDRAAPSYDANAQVQRIAVRRLAARIAALALPARPRVLEIGCGTGLLSEALVEALGPADFTFTDLSPAMVEACRARAGDIGAAEFRVMDAERPDIESGEGFDLVCASLAFQWLEDLPGALAGLKALVAPGGWLAYAALAEGTLREWRRACEDAGAAAATPAFPSAEALRSTAGGRIETETVVEAHADARGFIAGLKAIGAGLGAPGARPLGPAALKAAMARFEALGSTATYEIAYGAWRRPAARGVFVTGTDTGVGKTVVSAVLARAWGADYWKPVQTGLADEAGDTAVVAELAGLDPDRLHPPAFAFAPPVSPHLAADEAGEEIALDAFVLPSTNRPLVVEGAGGPLVPLNARDTMADLIARLGLPAVVVAPSRLGAISQTLSAVQALRDKGVEVAGVVLVGPPFADNRAAIEIHGKVRVLAELPWAAALDAGEVARLARAIPPLEEVAG